MHEDSHSEESRHPWYGGASINKNDCCEENLGEEILRCGIHRRYAKSVLAKASFVKVKRSYSAQDDNLACDSLLKTIPAIVILSGSRMKYLIPMTF
ncbi:MAG: hypothetical protein K8T10_17805, partial [Candidatus Eremiobacteraeota bacterium]|nr:hypothetical protein [Candidatus Eremiobacteraeota bacterium]